jgi:bifunctional non-homologous end joining protein LigD
VIVADDEVTVFSRNGADVTRTFPELSGIAAAVDDRQVVLDGEIVALDTEGRPSFTRLQRRWPQQRRPRPELVREVPVRFCAFDLLVTQGRTLTEQPYGRRRELLDDLMVVEKSRVLTVPRAMVDVAPADVLEAAASHAVEGIVVKRLDSPYRAGERSPFWIKIPVRATTELIIVAYWCAGGPGGRTAVGSLLMAGHNEAGDLVAIGQVGTGFSAALRRHLYAQLQPTRRSTSPVANRIEAPGVRWVEPRHVAEIAYREYVPGRWLRHTSFKGLRESADPARIQLPECG